MAQPTTAGVPRVVLDLAGDQLARGWDVHVATPDDLALRRRLAAAGARWQPWESSRAPGVDLPAEVQRLDRVLRTVQPDIVHLHSAKAGLAGRLALRGRRPTVFQPHAWSFLAVEGMMRVLATRWERVAARWADAVAVVSAAEQQIGERAGVRARWVLLPNGVDLGSRPAADAAARAAARSALGLPAGPLAVCVGRLCRQKGQDVLLSAWPRVRAAVPGARLVLVGDGPDGPALRRARPDGVLLTGAVEDADPWLVAADVAVLPSRWEAGLSLVAMEAMARARSVVSTAVPGVQEALAGGAGAVVPIDDIAALADAVRRRLGDPVLAASEGATGRRWVEQGHDLRQSTARAAELYRRLLR